MNDQREPARRGPAGQSREGGARPGPKDDAGLHGASHRPRSKTPPMQLRFSWGRRLSGTAHNGGRASAGPEIEDPGIHAVRVPGADRIEVPPVKPARWKCPAPNRPGSPPRIRWMVATDGRFIRATSWTKRTSKKMRPRPHRNNCMPMTRQRAYFPCADLAEVTQVSFSVPDIASHLTSATL